MADDSAQLERLIDLCKSNDIDVRVDAVTKLQGLFEAGIEINEPEPLISALKACLRTSNNHLTTATLSVLPPLLPLLLSKSVTSTQPRSLASSTLSTSSATTSSVVDVITLRLVLTAFLPSGGIIERLGDARDRARDKARESLVILGGLAFRSGGGMAHSTAGKKDGKGPETPFMIFERFLRDAGLGSKVWRVREQSILTLVHIRRTHHQFPIRPYLSLLVDALEDSDAHVRDCARTGVVELFSGPAVTDAARADLKKEMSKKGVRKTIIDSVLSKLLSASTSGGNSDVRSGAATPVGGRGRIEFEDEGSDVATSTTTAPGKGYMPPSLTLASRRPQVTTMASSTSSTTPGTGMSRSVSTKAELSRPPSRTAASTPSLPPETPSTDVEPVYIASSKDLEQEFHSMIKAFEGRETEHNWADRDRAVQRVRGMIKGGIHTRYYDTFMASLKESFIKDSLKTLASLRTTVATNTCALYSELAVALGTALDPWMEVLLANLFKMAGFTKKITAQQSQASADLIISNCSAQPRVVLPMIWNTLQEKTIQARMYAIGHVKLYIEIHGARARGPIESSGGLDILEKFVKKALADPNAGLRESARGCFWSFEAVWQERGQVILNALDSTARRQLEKACPDAEYVASLGSGAPPPTTTTKKSSVAAQIAASRAKAKAIANAPPSLMHQATSTSHAATRVTSPPPTVRRVVSSTATSSPSPPARVNSPTASTSSSPKSRVVSATGPMRSSSSDSLSKSQTRPASSMAMRADNAPLTPPDLSSSMRKRKSSPIASGRSPSSMTGRTSLFTPPKTVSPSSSTSSMNVSPSHPRQSSGSAGRPAPPTLASLSLPKQSRSIPGLPRESTTLADVMGLAEDSLLMATTIPIPEDDSTEVDMDESVNLISFSTPYEVYTHTNNNKSNSSIPASPTSKSMSPTPTSPSRIPTSPTSKSMSPAPTSPSRIPLPISPRQSLSFPRPTLAPGSPMSEDTDDEDVSFRVNSTSSVFRSPPRPAGTHARLPSSSSRPGGPAIRVPSASPPPPVMTAVPAVVPTPVPERTVPVVSMTAPETIDVDEDELLGAPPSGNSLQRTPRASRVAPAAAVATPPPFKTQDTQNTVTRLGAGNGSARDNNGVQLPRTPVNKSGSAAAEILRRAAMFQDSPAAHPVRVRSLLDVLNEQKSESGWWLKRLSTIEKKSAISPAQDSASRYAELLDYISALEQGNGGLDVLKNVAAFCRDVPAHEPPEDVVMMSTASSTFSMPASPSPLTRSISSALHHPQPASHAQDDVWLQNKNFDKLFAALMKSLNPSSSDEELEYALVVLWEMFEHQAPLLEGREADIFSALLTVRYSKSIHVLEGSNAIRDALTSRVDPVYGLTTVHGQLRSFRDGSTPDTPGAAEAKANTYGFGLNTLGRFILRLPDEILEEELPRLKSTLLTALNDKTHLIVRECAVEAIVAAQMVLRDQTHLFTLLDGLSDDKKDFLTYMFAKHQVSDSTDPVSTSTGASRGSPVGTYTGQWDDKHPGMEKLVKEMRRLDSRTSTPPRAMLRR